MTEPIPDAPDGTDELETLERRKLQLEIHELTKPLWKSSAFAVSFAVAAMSLVAGWFTGFFDRQLAELDLRRERLAIETLQLEDRRASLNQRVDSLRAQVLHFERSLDSLKQIAFAPELEFQRVLTNHEGDPAGIWLRNVSASAADVRYWVAYVDSGVPLPLGQREEAFTLLRSVGLNYTDVRYFVSENGVRLETGDSTGIVWVRPGASVPERSYLLQATNRLGFIACYCALDGTGCKVAGWGKIGRIPKCDAKATAAALRVGR